MPTPLPPLLPQRDGGLINRQRTSRASSSLTRSTLPCRTTKILRSQCVIPPSWNAEETMALPFLREQQQSCRMWHMLNRGSADVHEASEFQGNQASATYRSHPSTMTLMESQEAMINDMVEQVIEMRAYVHTMRERPASPPPILNFRNIRERRIRAHNKLVNASGGDPPLYWLLQRHRES